MTTRKEHTEVMDILLLLLLFVAIINSLAVSAAVANRVINHPASWVDHVWFLLSPIPASVGILLLIDLLWVDLRQFSMAG